MEDFHFVAASFVPAEIDFILAHPLEISSQHLPHPCTTSLDYFRSSSRSCHWPSTEIFNLFYRCRLNLAQPTASVTHFMGTLSYLYFPKSALNLASTMRWWSFHSFRLRSQIQTCQRQMNLRFPLQPWWLGWARVALGLWKCWFMRD